MRFVYVLFLVLLSVGSIPPFLLLCIMSAVFNGLPILFRQKRIGKNGKPFILYKFRTMRVGAEAEQKNLLLKNESDGPVFKVHNDLRYTGIGKFLAHTGLDEIPQLYNVVRGDMTLFGPRPLPIAEASKLKPWQKKRHAIKPGIISPAILTGKYHENFEAWMKSDISYVGQKSPAYDLRLAGRTMKFLASLLIRTIKDS